MKTYVLICVAGCRAVLILNSETAIVSRIKPTTKIILSLTVSPPYIGYTTRAGLPRGGAVIFLACPSHFGLLIRLYSKGGFKVRKKDAKKMVNWMHQRMDELDKEFLDQKSTKENRITDKIVLWVRRI